MPTPCSSLRFDWAGRLELNRVAGMGASGFGLNLDPRSVATEVSGITTFSHLAEMYYQASRLIPVADIHLKGMFDHHSESRHFWNTDAGKGQALAYAQQAAFTLELALKAYLEVLGKLASTDRRDIKKWQTHDLTVLFNLLTDDEKSQLEEWWNHRDTRSIPFEGSFREFLSAKNHLYKNWRYITDLKSPDLSMDIPTLLNASEFLLSASDRMFRKTSPFKVNITTTTYPSTENAEGRPSVISVPTMVNGVVRAVRIPEGFDPYAIVEVVIDSDQHEHEIVAHFYKRNVNDYFGLEGRRVSVFGEVREDRPHVLPHARHRGEPPRNSGYTTERRTLKGSVYDIRIVHSAYDRPGKVDLALWDETYSTQVECLFVTNDERDQLKEINLGDKVLIHGTVTLLNGQPMLMVGPEQIEKT